MTESTAQVTYGPYDADTPPPLAFHQWAELSARLVQRSRDERAAIFAQAGIDPALFEACNMFWLGALADQIAANNYRLAQTYANMCVLEMESRATAPPAMVEPADMPRLIADDLDETALLVALPDRTALPFQRPARLDALAREAEPGPPEADAPSGAGDTQFVPAVQIDDDPLPFRKPDGT